MTSTTINLSISISLATIFFCSGCTTKNVQITSEFPSPVIEPLPLTVGLYYGEELLQYVHREKKRGGPNWIVDLGPGHKKLFDQVFTNVFQTVIRVKNRAAPTAKLRSIDVLIEPKIEGYALETPMDSGIDFYQVSILYSINFYSPAGELVTLWPVDAYGKSRGSWYQTSQPVDEATILAMRDGAAQIVLKIADHPAFVELLNSEQTTTTDDTL